MIRDLPFSALWNDETHPVPPGEEENARRIVQEPGGN